MKIIVGGKPPTSAEEFCCTNCGCIFEAEKGEYTIPRNWYAEKHGDSVPIECECPCCHEIVCEYI